MVLYFKQRIQICAQSVLSIIPLIIYFYTKVMSPQAVHGLSRGGALRTRLQILASTRNGRIGMIITGTLLILIICKHLVIHPERSAGFKLFSSKYDIYAATPFCSPYDGTCGEAPDVPSPRTIYSAKSQKQYDDWWSYQAALNVSALEYSKHIAKKSETGDNDKNMGTKRPLILLGDSITESLLGTELGIPESKWDGIPEAFSKTYSKDYSTLVLGIAGDQTQHLLWRLQNGNLLPEYSGAPEAIFYVLIGTNNLGAGHLPQDATKGILAVVNYLLENVKGKILLLEVLPRGDSFRLETICPPRCDKDKRPFKSFMPAVDKVNKALRKEILAVSKKYHGRISLVDCGKAFVPHEGVSSKGEEVTINLMPDRLHPNAEGHRIIAKCVLDCIENEKS